MSACRLQKSNHMFVISNNTWHERGILGKKGERRGPYILGREGKGKRIETTKQIPSLLAGLGLQAYVSFWAQVRAYERNTYFSFSDFTLQRFPPPLSHEAARTLKYLKGISVKNGYRVVTVGSSVRAATPGPRSHVTVM